MTTRPGPGRAWLAARTGQAPDDLVSSPLAAVQAALGELALLAVRAESENPEERAAAQAEIAALRVEIATAPRPSDRFLSTVAGVLRDTAERLRRDQP